jgi:hypothetical protein
LANWRGRRIANDVGRIDELLGRGLRSPEAVSFVREGNALLVQLGEGVHTRTDPGPAVNRDCRRFRRRARERFRAARIRRAARRAGLDENEAAEAIASGRWDPFG